MELLRLHRSISAKAVSVICLQVLVLAHQAPTDNVDDDVGLAHINQHIVFQVLFQDDWLLIKARVLTIGCS